MPVAEAAAASVWQPLHPAEPLNTAWPAAALVAVLELEEPELDELELDELGGLELVEIDDGGP